MDLVSAASSIHLGAVLVAALSGCVIGGLWYSPLLFARPWMATFLLGAVLGGCATGGASAASHSPAAGVGRVHVAETTLDAPVAEVWRLFTTREGVESWMVAKAEVDLRVGGTLRTHYDPAGRLGDPNTITNTILSYEPQRMLSLQATGFPKDFPHRKGTEGTWSVLYFEALPDNRARLRLVSLGYGDDPESLAAYAFFEKGNAWTLEQLRKKLAPAGAAP